MRDFSYKMQQTRIIYIYIYIFVNINLSLSLPLSFLQTVILTGTAMNQWPSACRMVQAAVKMETLRAAASKDMLYGQEKTDSHFTKRSSLGLRY